jgi:hypothetical protein
MTSSVQTRTTCVAPAPRVASRRPRARPAPRVPRASDHDALVCDAARGRTSVRVALKEWGAVVAALAAGEQTVIFRKGGLRDGGKGFKLQADAFALFPTAYHPNERPEERRAFLDAPVPDMREGQSVPLAVVAKVTGAWVTHDPAVLDATSAHHGWSRETLASRLNWKPESPICVLELRAAAAAAADDDGNPPTLPPDPDTYGGCKSWLDLPWEVREGAPALGDKAFAERQRALRAALAALECDPMEGWE